MHIVVSQFAPPRYPDSGSESATPVTYGKPDGQARVQTDADVIREFRQKVMMAEASGRVRFLPYLDRNTEETQEIRNFYPQMMKDYAVKAATLTKLFSLASLDLNVTPGGDTTRDKDIADGFAYGLEHAAEGGSRYLVEAIAHPGMIFGTSITEPVWNPELHRRGKHAGKRFFKAFRSKDVRYNRIVQDQFGEITHIDGRNASGQFEQFDAADFIIFRNLPLFEGPGSSDFRAAYRQYWEKDTAEKLRMIHLQKFTSPATLGKYKDGDLETKAELDKQLELFGSRTYLTIPESAMVEMMNLSMKGESEFKDAIEQKEKAIFLAIDLAYLQNLVAAAGKDIRGDAKQQNNTFELGIWYYAKIIAQLINRHLVPRWVDHNYADADYPIVSFGGVSLEEMAKQLGIVQGVSGMGFKPSKAWISKTFNVTEATGPDDEMQPPQQGMGAPLPGQSPQQGSGMGGPFSFSDRRHRFADGKTKVPISGADGHQAEQLLAAAQRQGTAKLSGLAREAVGRLIAEGPQAAMSATALFSDDELDDLATQIRNTNATANLLGRARILKRAEQVERALDREPYKFSGLDENLPTDLRHCFNEPDRLLPMAPAEAVNYFARLFPQLGTNPERFGANMERHAFTLAKAADVVLLSQVQRALQSSLETGSTQGAEANIDDLLDAAGVGPRSSGYGEMVFRTNMMDSYNSGANRQLRESIDMFPVWKYSNPDDGRSRPGHAAKNGLYFPSTAIFADVRGTDISDVAQCRCTFIPIDRFKWSELQDQGAEVQAGWATAKFSERYSFAWVPYTGPRGGKGFKNTESGKVFYGAKNPGGSGGKNNPTFDVAKGSTGSVFDLPDAESADPFALPGEKPRKAPKVKAKAKPASASKPTGGVTGAAQRAREWIASPNTPAPKKGLLGRIGAAIGGLFGTGESFAKTQAAGAPSTPASKPKKPTVKALPNPRVKRSAKLSDPRFDESKVNRDKDGEFAPKGSGDAGGAKGEKKGFLARVYEKILGMLGKGKAKSSTSGEPGPDAPLDAHIEHALTKPAVGIAPHGHPLVMAKGKKYAVKHGSAFSHEDTIASSLASTAGVNMPPVHTVSIQGGKKANAVEWVDGAKDLANIPEADRAAALKSVPKSEVDRHALFDYAIGNSDNNDGNWMPHNGKLIGVDKAGALSSETGREATTRATPQFLRYLDDTGPGGYGYRFDRSELEHMLSNGDTMVQEVQKAKPDAVQGVKDRLSVLKTFSTLPDEALTVENLEYLGKTHR